MNNYLMKIRFIPNKIKRNINEHSYNKLRFVGYKKISKYCNVPIIQFSNKKRIWLLSPEIMY
uniref:Cytochrome b6-f complex subunit PetP n=1 Tax=Polysiphonia sp. TaxID=1967842 RepID=A0A1Z1M4B1_9FLOR|nr:cytochrome b6-f complex subunit PetP [Polysiphonia sp.]